MSRSKVFIIAEAGSNWRMGTPTRDRRMARALIDVAAKAGADAVKFQTYRADTVYVPNAGSSDYLSHNGIRESIIDIFKDLAMPYEMVPELADYCRHQKIEFMSSVFSVDDFKAVDPYVKKHKIASYEITHPHLLEAAARSGKPTILSTGASTYEEIDWAVDFYKKKGGKDLSLMQCTARYPAPLKALNLKVIPELIKRYRVPVGLSDHSREAFIGTAAAVALGATLIEKHYTLNNQLPGPDHAFAVTPQELTDLVRVARQCEETLGHGRKEVLPEERELHAYAQRGVQAIRPILRGDVFEEGVNMAILRPGKRKKGIHPKYLSQIEGKKSKSSIALGDGIQKKDFTG